MQFRLRQRPSVAVVSVFSVVAALCALSVSFAGFAAAGPGAQLYDLTCQANVGGQLVGPVPTSLLIASTSVDPDPAFPVGENVLVSGDVGVGVSGALQAGTLATVGVGSGLVELSAGSTLSIGASNSSSPAADVDISGVSAPWNGRVLGDLTLTANSTTVTSSASAFVPGDVGAAIAVSQLALPGALPVTAQIATFTDAATVELNLPATLGGTANGALAIDMGLSALGLNLGTFATDGVSGASLELLPVVTATTAINLSLGGVPATYNGTNDDLVNPVGCNYLPFGVSVIPGADYLPFGSVLLSDPGPVVNGGLPIDATVSATVPTSDIAVAGTDIPGITSWGIVPISAVGAATLTNVGPGPNTTIQYSPPDAAFEGIEVFELTASDGTTDSITTVTITVVGGDSSSQGVGQTVSAGSLDLVACGVGAADPSVCTINMSSIVLDGTEQVSSSSVNQITVTDARGLALGWTLTAQLSGALQNTDGTVTGANAEIVAANLRLLNQSCNVVDGPGSAAVPGSPGTLDGPVTLCSAANGTNAGTFTADADLELTVPASVFAGQYEGVINFIVT